MKNEHILELKNIETHYNGVKALDGVSLHIDAGEIVALMGPNGAGKSTVLKAIFGLVPLSHGHIVYNDQKMTPVPHEVVQAGIAFVPQGRRVFSHLTVEENLEMGGFTIASSTELKRRMSELYETFPVLHTKRNDASRTLSGGQQQLLALARGLMTQPHILLLDEPTLGLAPIVVKEIFDAIRLINERHGTTILIVEHNVKTLLNFVNRAYVLVAGQNFAEGDAHKLLKTDVLERAFLGKK